MAPPARHTLPLQLCCSTQPRLLRPVVRSVTSPRSSLLYRLVLKSQRSSGCIITTVRESPTPGGAASRGYGFGVPPWPSECLPFVGVTCLCRLLVLPTCPPPIESLRCLRMGGGSLGSPAPAQGLLVSECHCSAGLLGLTHLAWGGTEGSGAAVLLPRLLVPVPLMVLSINTTSTTHTTKH